MTDQFNLLPCPFCGEESDGWDNGPQVLGGKGIAWVECLICRAEGAKQYGEDAAANKRDAVSHWNRRIKDPHRFITDREAA